MTRDREHVRHGLAALPPFEREVIEMRFRLTGAKPRILQDVGAGLDIPPERIREIENEVLRLLADRPDPAIDPGMDGLA